MIGRNDAKIVLSAVDQTRAPFESAKKGLSGVGSAALSVKGMLATLGLGAVGAAFVSNVKAAANYADEMGKLAQRAGVTSEAISGLAYAAKLSDVDNQALAQGLRKLGIDAEAGGQKLAQLGIAITDAGGKTKTSDQLLADLADVLVSLESPAQRAAVAAKLLGEEVGPKLIPLLSGGSNGLREMTDEAQRFGRVVTSEAAAKAAEFNDNLSRLGETAAGIVQQMAGPVVSSLATAGSYFIKVANDVGLARAALISFGGAVARTLGVDDVGQLQSQARANQNAIALTVKQIETFQRLADRGVEGAAGRVSALREQYTQLQRTGTSVVQDLNARAKSIDDSFKPVAGSQPVAADVSGFLSAGPGRVTGAGRGSSRAVDDAKKAEQEFQQYLRGFDEARYGYLARRNDELLKEKESQEADHLEFLKGFDDARFEYNAQRNEEALQAEEAANQKRLQDMADFKTGLGDDLKGALSAAFRDTKDPLRAFGDAIANVVFTRVSGSLASSLVDGFLGGGSGGGIAGSFISSLLSFDGGGYTGAGSRAGGMDGRGGFMAMLHPNETVVDHTKGQGGGQPVTVIQHFTVGDVASVSMVRAAVAGSEQRITAGMGRSMRYGGALS